MDHFHTFSTDQPEEAVSRTTISPGGGGVVNRPLLKDQREANYSEIPRPVELFLPACLAGCYQEVLSR
jgi:hypothetical protein